MTELRYGPAPSTPAVWRYVLITLAVLGGPPAAAVAAFVAVVTWSGCFLSCSEPNHPVGALLGLLAAVLAVSGPALAWVLLRRWSAVGYALLGVLAWVTIAGLRLAGG